MFEKLSTILLIYIFFNDNLVSIFNKENLAKFVTDTVILKLRSPNIIDSVVKRLTFIKKMQKTSLK